MSWIFLSQIEHPTHTASLLSPGGGGSIGNRLNPPVPGKEGIDRESIESIESPGPGGEGIDRESIGNRLNRSRASPRGEGIRLNPEENSQIESIELGGGALY